ncbi:MAG: hypothetical protein ABIP94_18365, partial [Planctomycetota bacterium]
MAMSNLRVGVLAALLCSIVTPGQNPVGLTVEQALQLRQVANPQLGEDFVAFNLVVPRPLADGPGGSYLHLGVIDGLKALGADSKPVPRWLVTGKDSARSMAVRPGSREVSFLRAVDGVQQLFVQSIASGEAQRWAETQAVVAYRWRRDGKAIAFTVLDAMPEPRAAAQERGFEQVVVDEDWRHLSLWWCEEGAPPKRLTEGTTVFGFEWSPDGTKLACACAPKNLVDDSYMFERLHLLDVATRQLALLVDNPGKLGPFAWEPDGKRVAYVSAADRNDPHAGTLYAVDVESHEVEVLTFGLLGMVEGVQTTSQGLMLRESLGVRSRLRQLCPDRTKNWMVRPQNMSLAMHDAVADGERVVFAGSTSTHPAELFVAPVAGASSGPEVPGLQRLTDSNPELAGKALGTQRV